ncbi:alpha/beta fold hydrolase [Malacoplasma muris]|uniref:alpha/beta fold hydrolase n=1 Tax=Malacoplasma muris TaxID=2119 RepID=UPI00398E8CBF
MSNSSKSKNDNLDLKYLQVFEYGNKKNNKIILFIHGFYTDHRCFEPIYEVLSKTHKCICFNLPGCGNDPNIKYPTKYLSLEAMAKLITKYIIENDLKNFVLIGHSLGAAISVLINKELKNTRIKNLILLAPYSLASIPSVIDKVFMFNIKNQNQFVKLQNNLFVDYRNALKKVGRSEEEYFKEFIDFDKRNHKYVFHILIKLTHLISLKNLNDSYKFIKIPTHVFLGKKDKLVDFYIVGRYLSTQVGDNVEIYPYNNCGHAFFIENHEQFIKDIRKIIKNEKK